MNAPTFVARLTADETSARRIADLMSETLDPNEVVCAAFERPDKKWQVDLHFGERPENFFPAAIALFFVPQWIDQRRFAGFAPTYRIFALLALFLPMLVLAHWGYGSYLSFDRKVIEGMYQIFGFAGTALAIWFGARHHWNEVVNTGVTLFVIFLYTKLYDWWWDAMPKYLFFLLLGLIAVLLLIVFRRLRAAGVTRGSAEVAS